MTHTTEQEQEQIAMTADRALMVRSLNEWVMETGAVVLNSSWHSELQSIVEMAFDKGADLQAARRAPEAPVPQETCVICGSDAPYTGTCGSNDPRALCKKPAPQPPEAAPDCLTCNDHGAVGNILNAEPCPDCTMKRVTGCSVSNGETKAAPVQLPEPGINTANHAGIRVIGYTEQQVRELLAAHGIGNT